MLNFNCNNNIKIYNYNTNVYLTLLRIMNVFSFQCVITCFKRTVKWGDFGQNHIFVVFLAFWITSLIKVEN